MSAEILRRAAALMRERAEAAIHDSDGERTWRVDAEMDVRAGTLTIADRLSQPDAEHIASWHPAVALAVADWLADCGGAPGWEVDDLSWLFDDALTIARAYLGESDQ